MTRRERMLSLISRFDERRRRWELEGLIARRGYEALSDAALDELAARCVSGYRREQKNNRQNREQIAAKTVGAAPKMLEALLHARKNMPHPDQMIDDAIAAATSPTAMER